MHINMLCAAACMPVPQRQRPHFSVEASTAPEAAATVASDLLLSPVAQLCKPCCRKGAAALDWLVSSRQQRSLAVCRVRVSITGCQMTN